MPRQFGQVVLMLKNPLDWVTWPRPWQREHTSGVVPGSDPFPPHSWHL
jgi:hypothetical protein